MKKKAATRWFLSGEKRFAIGVGFGPRYRTLLFDVAQTLAEKVDICCTGTRQPYGLLWVGDVRPGTRLPGELVEAILDEFPGFNLGPMLPGQYGKDRDGVFIVLEREFPYVALYIEMIDRLMAPYAESTVLQGEVIPTMHIGRCLRSNIQPIPLSGIFEDLCPTSVAFGGCTEQGFVPVVWRSIWRTGITYGPKLRD